MAAGTCTFTPNPLKGFRQCAVQALPPPPPPFVDSPTALLLVVAFASAMGYALHNTFPCHGKRCGCLSGWQRELAEVLESAPFVGCVVLLILVDLACTFYTSVVAEEGELVEWAEWTGFRCLVFFLAEQALHYLAFGFRGFFGNPWFVMDAFAVSLTAVVELNEELLADELQMFAVIRLWKLFAFAFDVALVRKEASELVEKSEEQKKKL